MIIPYKMLKLHYLFLALFFLSIEINIFYYGLNLYSYKNK